MKRISHKALLCLVHYDPETGQWARLSNKQGIGWKRERVGYVMPTGYLRIKLGNKRYLGHVLAWFYMTGKWPKHIVDHKDNDKTNLCWDNLRKATWIENRVNSKCRRDNKTGFKGVHQQSPGVYVALLRTKKKNITLGRFDCPRKANAAYLAAAKKLYGAFARAS